MNYSYLDFKPIYALATPYQSSAVAIIRVSGVGSISLLNNILSKPIELLKIKNSKSLLYRSIVKDAGEVIDDCLVSVFKQGHGYTREEAAELSVHGSIAVIDAVCNLLELSGFRRALKGEFTYRAMKNGSMSLMESEAVLELIESDSEIRRKAALDRLTGLLDKKVEQIYHKVLEIFSLFELQMDYSTDEVDEDLSFPLEKINDAIGEVKSLLSTYNISKIQERGVNIVLAGDTNAGKSTLFNAILGSNRSIVSAERGTTRDYIKETLEISGVKVNLIDTAGYNDKAQGIEKQGVNLTQTLEKDADIVVYLLPDDDFVDTLKLNDERYIFVKNKIDIKQSQPVLQKGLVVNSPITIKISALTRKGIDELLKAISAKVISITQSSSNSQNVLITSARQQRELSNILSSLEKLSSTNDLELNTIECQNALTSCKTLLGIDEVSEDVLDEIFSRFCVGK